jgi:hypothetical protein
LRWQRARGVSFSTLAPQTHIPPHYGLANFKLTAIEKSELTRLFGPIDAFCNYRLSGIG